VDALGVLTSGEALPACNVHKVSDTRPHEWLLLDHLTGVLDPAVIPSVPCPDGKVEGRGLPRGRIRFQQAGLNHVRLLDQVPQFLLHDVCKSASDQLAAGQAEEITKRVIGPGDAECGIEGERAHR
jgi:hypothetical protein